MIDPLPMVSFKFAIEGAIEAWMFLPLLALAFVGWCVIVLVRTR